MSNADDQSITNGRDVVGGNKSLNTNNDGNHGSDGDNIAIGGHDNNDGNDDRGDSGRRENGAGTEGSHNGDDRGRCDSNGVARSERENGDARDHENGDARDEHENGVGRGECEGAHGGRENGVGSGECEGARGGSENVSGAANEQPLIIPASFDKKTVQKFMDNYAKLEKTPSFDEIQCVKIYLSAANDKWLNYYLKEAERKRAQEGQETATNETEAVEAERPQTPELSDLSSDSPSDGVRKELTEEEKHELRMKVAIKFMKGLRVHRNRKERDLTPALKAELAEQKKQSDEYWKQQYEENPGHFEELYKLMEERERQRKFIDEHGFGRYYEERERRNSVNNNRDRSVITMDDLISADQRRVREYVQKKTAVSTATANNTSTTMRKPNRFQQQVTMPQGTTEGAVGASATNADHVTEGDIAAADIIPDHDVTVVAAAASANTTSMILRSRNRLQSPQPISSQATSNRSRSRPSAPRRPTVAERRQQLEYIFEQSQMLTMYKFPQELPSWPPPPSRQRAESINSLKFQKFLYPNHAENFESDCAFLNVFTPLRTQEAQPNFGSLAGTRHEATSSLGVRNRADIQESQVGINLNETPTTRRTGPETSTPLPNAVSENVTAPFLETIPEADEVNHNNNGVNNDDGHRPIPEMAPPLSSTAGIIALQPSVQDVIEPNSIQVQEQEQERNAPVNNGENQQQMQPQMQQQQPVEEPNYYEIWERNVSELEPVQPRPNKRKRKYRQREKELYEARPPPLAMSAILPTPPRQVSDANNGNIDIDIALQQEAHNSFLLENMEDINNLFQNNDELNEMIQDYVQRCQSGEIEVPHYIGAVYDPAEYNFFQGSPHDIKFKILEELTTSVSFNFQRFLNRLEPHDKVVAEEFVQELKDMEFIVLKNGGLALRGT